MTMRPLRFLRRKATKDEDNGTASAAPSADSSSPTGTGETKKRKGFLLLRRRTKGEAEKADPMTEVDTTDNEEAAKPDADVVSTEASEPEAEEAEATANSDRQEDSTASGEDVALKETVPPPGDEEEEGRDDNNAMETRDAEVEKNEDSAAPLLPTSEDYAEEKKDEETAGEIYKSSTPQEGQADETKQKEATTKAGEESTISEIIQEQLNKTSESIAGLVRYISVSTGERGYEVLLKDFSNFECNNPCPGMGDSAANQKDDDSDTIIIDDEQSPSEECGEKQRQAEDVAPTGTDPAEDENSSARAQGDAVSTEDDYAKQGVSSDNNGDDELLSVGDVENNVSSNIAPQQTEELPPMASK